MSGRDPDRRVSLLGSALSVVDEFGPAMTMGDVAAGAGITKPVLYRHFGSKAGLYEALAGLVTAELLAAIVLALGDGEVEPRARMEQTIGAFLAAIERQPQRYRFLLAQAGTGRPEVSQTVGDFTHHLARRVAPLVRDAFTDLGLEIEHPLLVAHGIVGLVHQIGTWWLHESDMPRHEVQALIVHLAWSGVPTLGRLAPT